MGVFERLGLSREGPWGRPSYLPVTAPVPDVITTRLTLGVRLTEPVHGDGWRVFVMSQDYFAASLHAVASQKQ